MSDAIPCFGTKGACHMLKTTATVSVGVVFRFLHPPLALVYKGSELCISHHVGNPIQAVKAVSKSFFGNFEARTTCIGVIIVFF